MSLMYISYSKSVFTFITVWLIDVHFKLSMFKVSNMRRLFKWLYFYSKVRIRIPSGEKIMMDKNNVQTLPRLVQRVDWQGTTGI